MVIYAADVGNQVGGVWVDIKIRKKNNLCSNIFPENSLAFGDQKHDFLSQLFTGFFHLINFQEINSCQKASDNRNH